MKAVLFILLLICLIIPAHALEIEAPVVPASGRNWMPENTDSFSEGLTGLVRKAAAAIHPNLKEAVSLNTEIIIAVMLVSVITTFSDKIQTPAETAGVIAVASMILKSTNSMICLASDTVREIADYGMLLLPVMTAAFAAQGSISASAALYAGTAAFISVLQKIMETVFMPCVYLYLAFMTGHAATGEAVLKRIGDMLKGLLIWCLKTMLMIFTTYLGLSGVICGTTDAAALKAAKLGMSTFIPVVGGVLADASEAVLVSTGLLKNAAGIYGILAVLALFLHPFLQIGIHYLVLKLTGAVCIVFGNKAMTNLLDSFTSGMGILMGMTASACIMVLISTVCFMKGVS